MQRWFYANEELICKKQKKEEFESASESSTEPLEPLVQRDWRFCVKLKDRELLPNEAIAISGNCEELGNWQLENCILMAPIDEDQPDIWHVYVKIPAERDVSYRYLIVAIDSQSNQMIVRFFESHLKPRIVPANLEAVVDVCEDVFGWIEGSQKVERGWLTSERIIQFMFYKSQFKWDSPILAGYTYQIKVTPYFRTGLGRCPQTSQADITSQIQPFFEDIENISRKVIEGTEDEEKVAKEKQEEYPIKCGEEIRSFTKLDFSASDHTMSFSQRLDETMSQKKETVPNEADGQADVKLSTAFAFNEVVNSRIYKSSLQRQPTYGTLCESEDLITVHLTIGDFKNTVYLIELFKYSKNANLDELPYRVGYRYVLPEDFRTHEAGYMEVPIICASKHRPIGFTTFHFLIICPSAELKLDLSVSYLRHWNKKRTPMDGGHRGLGISYNTSDNSIIHENTIYSLKQARENGADMVEFDVQLTKDHVPVIFHDFNVHVSKRDPTLIADSQYINIPLSRYTYDALMNLKIPSRNEETPQIRVGDATGRQQLFPKLVDALNEVPEDVAFDIEVKWPQQACDRRWQENVRPTTSRNFYVDRILQVVLPNARKRRIVFSCFDPDICTLLRFKQNLYPVMLLMNNEGSTPALDPRARNPLIAVNFSFNMELLGVVPHAWTLINNPRFIGESWIQDLVVFAYGIDDHDEVDVLKKMGVNAVILDRIDKFAEQQKALAANCGGGDANGEKKDEECHLHHDDLDSVVS